MGHLEQLHSVGSGIVELIKLFQVRNQTSSGRDVCGIEEHQRNKKLIKKHFEQVELELFVEVIYFISYIWYSYYRMRYA